MEFRSFGKIPRFSRTMTVTEKIDGTNASVYIETVASSSDTFGWLYVPSDPPTRMRFGSKKRWIIPEDDNFGFAAWGFRNAMELAALGPGHHFGEWWGVGINRGYGLHERRFSLFNVARWSVNRPGCCHVVPILYQGPFCTGTVDAVLATLASSGSAAAPGFMRPEGVIVQHDAGGHLYKKTIEKDDEPKGRGDEGVAGLIGGIAGRMR